MLLVLGLVLGIGTAFNCAGVNSSATCRFSLLYPPGSLVHNLTAQEEFLCHVMYWEGQFHQPGIGYNGPSALTMDGHPIDHLTGLPVGEPHLFSAASKESIHIGILTLAVSGNPLAQRWASPDNSSMGTEVAANLLSTKMGSMEKFNASYPGFGGFLPWFAVSDEGASLLDGWTNMTPGLDNGEMIWAMIGAAAALEQAGYGDVAARYHSYVAAMASVAMQMFVEPGGHVRSVVHVPNITLSPSMNNYTDETPGSYLDDPYEGELFAFFLDLFCTWSSHEEREQMWINKRPMLQAVDLVTSAGNITVERGYWYSAHEKWKYLMLPYTLVDINRRVYLNGERARTWFNAEQQIPGLMASVNDVSTNDNIPTYVSALGIQKIAFQQAATDIVTPYGTMALYGAAGMGVGLEWYNTMLRGPRMQGILGSTEAVNVTGQAISPVTTWDSKETTVLAMLGGLSHIVRSVLQEKDLLSRFEFVVNREWTRVFGDNLKGEDLPFRLPTVQLPQVAPVNFPVCS